MNPPGLTWSQRPARELLADAALRARWDALNAARRGLPILGSAAVAASLRHFGRGDERLLLADAGAEPAAMLLVQPVGRWRWQTWQPSQLPLGAWVAAPRWSPQRLAQSWLASQWGAAAVLSITQVDPLDAPSPGEGPAIDVTPYIDTGWIDLEGSFDGYWAGRGKNLRSNMRKQRSRLEADGVHPRLAVVAEADGMAPTLQRYGALESAGWKSRGGTAIHLDNQQGRFYRELMEQAAAAGEALVFECWFDDRMVASNLCLQRSGTLIVLKTTYDETIDKSLSPAFLLHQDMLQHLYAVGSVRRLEYFGRFQDWHARWTDDKRPIHHLTCYRWSWVKTVKAAKARLRRLHEPQQIGAETAGAT